MPVKSSGMWMPVVDRCLSMIYKTHPTLMMWNAYIPVGVPILVIIATNIWMFIIAARYSKSKGFYATIFLVLRFVSCLFYSFPSRS